MAHATLRLSGRIVIAPMHWALWAERERGPRVRGPGLSQIHLEPQTRELRSIAQLYEVEERDEDIAAAIGQGVRRLEREIPSKGAAVRSRWVAWSDHVQMRTLAKRFGVTPARVSQMADEGEDLVERWVLDVYGE